MQSFKKTFFDRITLSLIVTNRNSQQFSNGKISNKEICGFEENSQITLILSRLSIDL